MKNIIILLLLIFSGIFALTYAYDAFDGNYHYSDANSVGQYNRKPSPDDEVLFIIDFSSSMNSKMGYSPKIYLAIDAIRNILSNSSSQTKIGVRTFGISKKQLYRKTTNGLIFDEKAICTASNLAVPISRYNSSSIMNSLSRINPNGGTPIGYALRQAVANDFSVGNHLKHIILITDGEENCGDNPCVFISNLLRTRKDFRIDVIGITIDQNAYSQLNCIASAGNGKLYTVNNLQDFKIKFQEAFNAVPRYTEKTYTNNPTVTTPQQTQTIVPPAEIPNIRYKTYGFQFYN